MDLLTAKRQALLNDMLQIEHIKMFIGLKLDIDTIPNAECMKTIMTTVKSLSPDAFFSILHTTPCAIWQQVFDVLAVTEIDESMRSLLSLEMGKMVTHMLYLVLAVGFKWCGN